jgi:hypothetical protein
MAAPKTMAQANRTRSVRFSSFTGVILLHKREY